MTPDLIIIFLASVLVWLIGGFLVVYPWLGEKRQRLFTVLESIFAAMVSRFGITELIRYFYDSPRPFETIEGARKIIEHSGGGSFPSGHAAFFFAVAATFYLYNKKLGYILFSAAILMGIGRVYANLHWPIDIIGGATIGIISSLIVNAIIVKFKLTERFNKG